MKAQASGAPPFRGQARYAVLALLAFGEELTGYAIHQRTKFTFRYFFGDIAHSQVYRELTKLEDLGLVSSREVSVDDRAGRAYKLTKAGEAELSAWAHAARFDPPTLRFPVALKVWLGHLTEVSDMRAALVRQQRYIEDMLDTIEQVDRGTAEEPQWLYPGLVNRWSRRIWEATQEATAELIKELEALEPDGPKRPRAKKAKS